LKSIVQKIPTRQARSTCIAIPRNARFAAGWLSWIEESQISPEELSGDAKKTRANTCFPSIGAASKDDWFFDARLKVQEGETGVQEIFQQNGWNVRHCRPIRIGV
jgi:hypothetical protein